MILRSLRRPHIGSSFCRFSSFIVDGRFKVPIISVSGETILQACEREKVAIEADCKEGKCKTCRVWVHEGEPSSGRTPDDAIERLACQEPAGNISGFSLYRHPPGERQPTYFETKEWMKKVKQEEGDARAKIRKQREEEMNTKEAMKERYRYYLETTGVDPHLSDDEEEIDWEAPFGWKDTEEAANRCFVKYRDTPPGDITTRKVRALVKKLPGFSDPSPPSEEQLEEIQELWEEMWKEELDRVTFDNCASYEP